MISKEECKKIINLAVAHGKGKADGIEVTVNASDVATSRFANNSMTQNQSPFDINVSVRALVDGRQARLSTDQTSPSAIRKVVDNAIDVAKLLNKDPELLPLYQPDKSKRPSEVNRFDLKTSKTKASERAKRIKSIIEIAQTKKLNSSGIYATGSAIEAIGNSEGLFEFHQESVAECSITMTAPDSSGWAKIEHPQAKDVDVEKLAKSAAEKAALSAKPQELPPGKYTVILEPSAVLDLLAFLWYDFAGTSITDKLSCFLDKLNTKMLGTNINIHDDVTHPMQAGSPFDGEGVPRNKVALVENGVVKGLVHGRRSAKKFNVQPTGHGLAEPCAEGEYPLNLVVEGGNTSLEEMIASTDKGVLLTRVWYVREVDPTAKIVTGLTRDGTFLIENGKVKCGVKNFRFNQGLLEMLLNVVAMSPSVRAAGEEGFPCVVPAMKVKDFHFVSPASSV